jgi:hypothetical protein
LIPVAETALSSGRALANVGGVSSRLMAPILLLPEQAQSLGLQEDEVVQALVESLPAGVLGLMVQGQSLPLGQMAQSQLSKGERYSLKAKSNADGGWSLMPLPAKSDPEVEEVAIPDVATRLQLAPLYTGGNQSGISNIAKLLYRPDDMADLSALVQPGVLTTLLEELARPDLLMLWQSMQLNQEGLNSEVLQETVLNFLGPERWLGKGQAPPSKDLKGLLRQLLAVLEHGLKPGLGLSAQVLAKLPLVRGALDDLESAQVRAVQAQTQNELLFKLVLPFQDSEPVELTFRRAPNQWGELSVLTVNVHSESETLGPIWLKTELHAKDRIDLTMWANRPEVLENAKNGTDQLIQILLDAGLIVGNLQVLPGPRPAVSEDFVPSGRGLVVDVAV